MRGVYTAHVEITSLSLAKTILLGEVPSSCAIEILSAMLTESSASLGEQLRAGLYRVTTLGSPVGGTSVNIQKSSKNDASTLLTWLGDLTTEPTAYDAAPMDAQGFFTLSGYEADIVPETRIEVPPSSNFAMRLLSAPVTAFRCLAQIKYRELG